MLNLNKDSTIPKLKKELTKGRFNTHVLIADSKELIRREKSLAE